ncbi:Galactose oxidase, central domain-containing protein [Cladophialophora immunda]|nr:Galactose oxidase, central domain-containing protein [Cladophialophora immunda]
MAEVAAGLYAVETVFEGAALGAFAVSRPTAPLHLGFRKLSLPVEIGDQLARSGHTFNIVKGKAYIIGGYSDSNLSSASLRLEKNQTPGDNAVLALTLPVASSTDGEGDVSPCDYEVISPTYKDAGRPLAPQSGTAQSEVITRSQCLLRRTGHSTVAVGDKLYIWGGNATSDVPAEDFANHFVVFDTLTSTYELLKVDISRCADGMPSPRTNHAACSSPHPIPNRPREGIRPHGEGTIFIHGGA